MADPRPFRLLDPALSPAAADAMTRALEGRGPYRVYVDKPKADGLGKGLVRRHDAALNHALTRKEKEPLHLQAARINLFRGTFAELDRTVHPGGEPLRDHPGFAAAAREITDRPLVVPTMLYANVLLPGQELLVHNDTPEYRGLDKTRYPEWFLVSMMASGLFERWRVPIIGAVSFYGACTAGELYLYADGPDAPPLAVPPRHNTAVVLDADALFHGVARVGGPDAPAPPVEPNTTLDLEDGRWVLRGPDGSARGTWERDEVRYSFQWKALCFRDEAERRLYEDGSDDLEYDEVVARMVDDLRERGALQGDLPDGTRLAITMIREYIRFPTVWP